MNKTLRYIFLTLLYDNTGNDVIDSFIWYSSLFLEIAAVIGVLLLIFFNKPLQKRKRTQDRLIFWECILVLCQNLVDLSLIH